MHGEGAALEVAWTPKVKQSARMEVEAELILMAWTTAEIGNENHTIGWAELRGGFAALAWLIGAWDHSVAPDHAEEPEREAQFQALMAEYAAKYVPEDDEDDSTDDE